MPVDSFKFLPRLIAMFYQMTEREPSLPIPWTPLSKPVGECTFGLVTSAGLYHKREDAPFDLEREIQEPTWGDPSYRTIPTDIDQEDVGVSHLHINPKWVLADVNVLLPLTRFQELASDGKVGTLAGHAYSFMGYQGYPPDTEAWEKVYAPQVAERFKAESVDCVLLTPA
jgi:D-proline reductase (dithiol) PrdB